MIRGAPSSTSSSSPLIEQTSDGAAQTDTSAMAPEYNEPQIYQAKVTRISRIAWVAGAAIFIILGMLTSSVIYLFMRDSSTENAIKIRDMAVKEIEGDLERYAQAYWLQLEEDERHFTMLAALKNESNILKAQLAESAAREDSTNRTVSTIINELSALKLAVLEEKKKEDSMNRTVSTIINELSALKLAVLEEKRKEESLNRTFSAIISELLALKVSIPDDQITSQTSVPTGQDIYSISAEVRDISTMRMHSSSTSLRRNYVNVIGALCIVLYIRQSL